MPADTHDGRLELRKTLVPHIHRVPRMPAHYNRAPLDRLQADPLALAVVLPETPAACPKCRNQVLRHSGLEVSCLACGWAQLVRR